MAKVWYSIKGLIVVFAGLTVLVVVLLAVMMWMFSLIAGGMCGDYPCMASDRVYFASSLAVGMVALLFAGVALLVLARAVMLSHESGKKVKK